MSEDFIQVVDNAITPDTCQQIINIFESSKNLGIGKTGGGVDKTMKNSVDVSINRHAEFEPIRQQVFKATTERLIDYFRSYYFALIAPIGLTMKDPKTGNPVKLTHENFAELGEPQLEHLMKYVFRLGEINAQRYTAGEGGYPYWHSETYPQPKSVEALHRVLLFMFYLNDVEEGGETEFFYQQKKIRPKAGTMVIAPSGFTHTHRGNIPVSNDKYILTSWVLFNPANALFAAGQ
ncbi:2OG-Fe(II) oxygenase [Glaciecola sp. 1036]|uniref:2OG-Fe(II) oxygenase family protein n=1 Tax=Alteromonadaceae TaxID=72275 RepID=UPI003CFD5A9F